MIALPIEIVVPAIFAAVALLGWMAHRALNRWPGEDD